MNAHDEIILGVGGGIAAYKSCDLLRRLQDRGLSVTVVPTPSSLNFVGQATWEALSGKPAASSVFESVDQVRHVSLAKNARAIIIAPATADLIARIAAGRADDLLTNTVLASTSPIVLVPAMHPAMWSNPATVSNVATLRSRGMHVMEPSTGALTSGDVGKGRFPGTAEIIDYFTSHIAPRDLVGKRVIVTAGGTREPIDPVRYIGNISSGKQGIALAQVAASRGADVTLILANAQAPDDLGITTISVKTASEMLTQLQANFSRCDILFMAAAIADARPAVVSESKLKKREYTSIQLIENPDVLATVASEKQKQIIVAFAAETSSDAHSLAFDKLKAKNADLIFLNNVSGGAIFGADKTQGRIIDPQGNSEEVGEISKEKLASLLIDKTLDRLG